METKHIVLAQSIARRYISNASNIYKKFRNPKITKNFENEIKGYHLMNKTPLKESLWEDINTNIVKEFCVISDEANGNHLPGKDNKYNNWNISNKTCKLGKNGKVSISSYRLSSVCNNKSPSTKEKIVEEIHKRDSNFDYYSILIREEDENDKNKMTYMWCVIPKNYYIFNVETQEFTPKMGKQKRSQGQNVGWTGKYFDINFSMSSQLWYHFQFDDIKQFVLAKVTTVIPSMPLTYSQIYNLVNEQ
jgi:hypothetical protein